jgi:hypothetical protein
MIPNTLRTALLPLALAAGLATAVAAPAAAQSASAVPTACPDTFSVLHDDAIGALSLPAGPYTITVGDPSKLSCAEASDLFRQFLEDWDGVLPKPWKLNAATATFSGGSGKSFSVARAAKPSGGGGGRHPATGLLCPGTFQVLHNDHIGKLSVPKGQYTITLLSAGSFSCSKASKKFAAFLQDFDGKLPSPWIVDNQTATFSKAGTHVGFRVEPAVNPTPGGGGKVYPGGTKCPGTFRVLHNDSIGSLSLPKGRYVITIGKSGKPTCSQASTLLAKFLDDPDGDLPSPWKLKASTGTFSAPGKSFRIKPAA